MRKPWLTVPVSSRWVLAVAALWLSGCWDYGVRLPNGYELVRIYASAVLIVDPQRQILVEAHIDAYSVVDHLVVGHVARAEYPPEREMSMPGYFVLNTRTAALKQGLTRTEWRAALRAVGLAEAPPLSAATRFDGPY